MNMGRTVFGYHAGRAGLDAAGGTAGPPVGLDDLRKSAYTHVGVPMDHADSYVQTLISVAGVRVIRTMEAQWNPGLNKRDLGRIILDFVDVHQPGPFLSTWLINIQEPCHGFAWNLEHDITDASLYPITAADMHLARLWKFNLAVPAQYVAFRCQQFTIIARLMKKLGAAHWGEFTVIIYSEYGEGARERYGCDWNQLSNPFLKLGAEALPLIDYAHCAYFGGVKLSPEYRNWLASLPENGLKVLHNTQLPHPLNTPEGHRGQVADRLGLMANRPGDGFGSCDAEAGKGQLHLWDDPDRDVSRAITQGMRLAKDPGLAVLQSMSWGQIKASMA
ncbi:MAG: hypothetical protein HYT31_03695 [Parcubacteria group bacterium]|nr:hypothetical protein [Parcubacteria group bacterium]